MNYTLLFISFLSVVVLYAGVSTVRDIFRDRRNCRNGKHLPSGKERQEWTMLGKTIYIDTCPLCKSTYSVKESN